MDTKQATNKEPDLQLYQLDNTDKQLLQLLQNDFPITTHPWKELSHKIGLSEQQIINRIENLYAKKIIQKIGPIIDNSKIGYTTATLVALRVPENQVDTIAAIINQYSDISHNYEREHEYNIWFTLVAKNTKTLTQTLNEILQKTGLNQNDILNLPTKQRFKINVNFRLTDTI
ncbi:MAG: AsnC family transcriptional regulator [Nitrososphaerota archaeon]|jgi:DNA-binding Lrp family transcriptional regulator|nr:AsnC family transcriptional regulator [Nitrososphaerota archaeon]